MDEVAIRVARPDSGGVRTPESLSTSVVHPSSAIPIPDGRVDADDDETGDEGPRDY